MWQSPVNFFEIHEPIVEEINKQTEETVFKAIHRVGVDVNKEELIKALQYDRNQYEKGYKDGYNKAIEEFKRKLLSCEVKDEIRMMIPYEYIYKVAEELKGGQE